MLQNLTYPTHQPVVTPDDYQRLSTSTDGCSPVDDSDRICTRFVVRLVPWPIPRQSVRDLSGGVLVVGNHSHARALVSRLIASGVPASSLPLPTSVADIDTFLSPEASTPRHLVLMSSLDLLPTGGYKHWGVDRDRSASIPYLLVQRWYAQQETTKQLDGCTLVCVTSLGTPGGLADGVTHPAHGALTGMVKGIATERRSEGLNGFRAAVVDLPVNVSEADVCNAVIDELFYEDGNVEIVYSHGQRYCVRPINVPLDRHPNGRKNRLAAGPWVITGGARGVTAEVARAFAGHPGVFLHLLGSSPARPIPTAWLSFSPDQLRQQRTLVMQQAKSANETPSQAWAKIEKSLEIARTLHDLANAGVDASYHCCDVADPHALDHTLQFIRKRHGGIVGVIHGAGFEQAARFSRKKPELVQRTLGPKVDGAVALMQLTQQDPLQCFIAFGSISGRFGSVGQSDYSMANECLAKWMRWYRNQRPDVIATSVSWHSWDAIGMAVRPESKFAKIKQGQRFMPPDEGVQHLLWEIDHGCPEPEVVITDWQYFKMRHPDPLLMPDPAVTPPDIPVRSQSQPPLASYPLIDAVKEYHPYQQLLALCHLDPLTDPFLNQSRRYGQFQLPTAIVMELMAEAAAVLTPGATVAEIADFQLDLQPHAIGAESVTAQVLARLQSDAATLGSTFTDTVKTIHCEVMLRDRRIATGRVVLATGNTQRIHGVPTAPDKSWLGFPTPAALQAVVAYGPAFQRHRGFRASSDQGWAQLLPGPPSELLGSRQQRWILPVDIIEASLQTCGIHSWIFRSRMIAVPQSFDRWVWAATGSPTTLCIQHIHALEQQSNQSTYGFELFDDFGTPIAHVENLVLSTLAIEHPVGCSSFPEITPNRFV